MEELSAQAATSLLGMPAVLAGEVSPKRGRFVAIAPNLEVMPSVSGQKKTSRWVLVKWGGFGGFLGFSIVVSSDFLVVLDGFGL